MKRNPVPSSVRLSLLAVAFPLACITWPSPLRAEVKPNGIFSDGMVLQREAKVPVWGTAAPGEKVEVALGERHAVAVTTADGKWRAELENLPPGGPFTLRIAAGNDITIGDVLVGDVWLCSGQSNMAFSMSSLASGPYAADLTSADFPLIRQGTVPRVASVAPLDTTKVTWTACSPSTVGGFTAAGFYFARELQKEIHVPVGLVFAAWGGTSAESWTGKPALDTVPDFRIRADEQLANLASLPERIKGFPAAIAAWESAHGRVDSAPIGEAQGWAAPDADPAAWRPGNPAGKWRDNGMSNGGIAWLRKEITLPANAAGKDIRIDFGQVDGQCTTTYFNGEKVGSSGRTAPQFDAGYVNIPIPGRLVKAGKNVLAVRFVSHTGDKTVLKRKLSGIGFAAAGAKDMDETCLVRVESEFPPLKAADLAARPQTPTGDAAHTSGALFGGMIHPLIPFAMRGVLWYQGEQDAGRAHAYRTLLPLMITDWRKRWGRGEFPFIIQQLPEWNADGAGLTAWAEMREAQALTADALPHCGLSVGLGLGEAGNVHPQNKREIGRRLALVALDIAYGIPIASSGPVFDTMTAENAVIRLKFRHGDGLRSLDGGPLHGFRIAGEDKQWVPADARIDGDAVIVSAPSVTRPLAVRYGYINAPLDCNLTNSSGLPARPFRTDTWPVSTDSRK